MTDKKICIPAMITALAALVMSFFGLVTGGIILSAGTMIFSIAKRKKYRAAAPVAVSVLALLISAAFLAILIAGEVTGTASTDYWLMRLIFGEMR